MRNLPATEITAAVRALCIQACEVLPEDVAQCLSDCKEHEPWPAAADALARLQENARLASEEHRPLCQDTGMCCVFASLGQDVHITGGDFYDAINEGVRQGYQDGFLRKSIVKDPLRRKNTGDNTPAFVSLELVPGDRLSLTVAPKGIGSENMSRLAMLPPSAGESGVLDFVVDCVRRAGGNPCPPVIVGVGLGGNFDKAPALAKKALLRPLNKPHQDAYYQALEAELLRRINSLGIGPQGFGGKTTALAVAIETAPTHIAGLPVAVNLNCHAARHACTTL